jgi:hypothetical protein
MTGDPFYLPNPSGDAAWNPAGPDGRLVDLDASSLMGRKVTIGELAGTEMAPPAGWVRGSEGTAVPAHLWPGGQLGTQPVPPPIRMPVSPPPAPAPSVRQPYDSCGAGTARPAARPAPAGSQSPACGYDPPRDHRPASQGRTAAPKRRIDTDAVGRRIGVGIMIVCGVVWPFVLTELHSFWDALGFIAWPFLVITGFCVYTTHRR